jgi:hypothetical protein
MLDSCYDGNEQICAGYEGCLVLTLAAPKPKPPPPPLTAISAVTTRPSPQPTILSTPEPIMSQSHVPTKVLPFQSPIVEQAPVPDPTTKPLTIPAAPLDAITKACTGLDKTSLISSGDEQAKAECLSVCSQGACCYADVFNAIGIHVIASTGSKNELETCFAGNEVVCGGYSGCLTLSLAPKSRPETVATTVTPAPTAPLIKYVPDAPKDEISKACTSNQNLIMSGDEQAKQDCFNVCQPGICCYSSVFGAMGMQRINDQGNKVDLESCFDGNEIICGGYSGCLTLTLSA